MPEEKKTTIPFMDSFYSLSSNEPSERNVAASSLLQHIFLSTDSTDHAMDGTNEETTQKRFDALIKDGCYAFTRLLKGLCSGRASARQGYASCLTSFLKLSFQLAPPEKIYPGKSCWMDLFMEQMDASKDPSLTSIEFVRKHLLQHTSSTDCSKDRKGATIKAKKGSEERDQMFGKLFGILAVVRSGTLKSDSSDSSFQTLKGYVSDLLGLYDFKKWMREPAIHALKESFHILSTHSSKTVAELLDDDQLCSFFEPDSDWTAEKIALYLHLQTLFSDKKAKNKSSTALPKLLTRPLLTVSSLQGDDVHCNMQTILRDTSTVVHPRCHMVWESIWTYLCAKGQAKKKATRGIIDKNLVLRKTIPIGDDSPADIMEAIVNKVIVESLLGQSDENNITNERRVLAMSLVSQLCELELPSDLLERVILHPTIILQLFLKTLPRRHQKVHTLKPLANNILQHIVSSLCSGENHVQRRLAAIRCFLQADPSFDAVTQTQTVSSLLGVNTDEKDNVYEIWEQYVTYLQKELFEKLTCEDGVQDAIKFVDLIFNFTKRVCHIGNDDHRQHFFRRTSLILTIGAFFDLNGFVSKSNKKDVDSEGFQSVAQSIHKDLKRNTTLIPVPNRVRVKMSSRFFSLLSDYITTDKRGKSKNTKISLIIAEVSQLQNAIEMLVECGATLVNKGTIIDNEETEGHGLLPFQSSLKTCSDLKELIAEGGQEKDEMTSLGLSAILGLVSSLSLQLLHPGQPNTMDEDDEDEVDEIFDEVHDIVSDLSEIASYIKKGDYKKGEEENPLLSLAVVFVNILNSSIGGSGLNPCIHLGAGPKLIRDCVQLAWGTVLTSVSSESSTSNATLDEDVMSLLLESVCSPEAFSDPTNYDTEDGDDEMGEADSSDDDEPNDDIMSAFTEANATGVEVDDMEVDEGSEQNDEDSDVELDPSSLENLLLEDRDDIGSDEETTLEHHSGADDALAQLIKLKQENRKSGKSKQEKIELSNRQRCFSLLESVITSNRRNPLPNQLVLMVILPLLRTRTILQKSLISLEKSISTKSGNSIGEKRALVGKITSFLADKVCKTKFNVKTNSESCEILAKQIMIELKSVDSADHCNLCSSLLVVVVKAVGGNDFELSKTLSDSIYSEAVKEWSTRRKTKLRSSIFEDLIGKCPSVAKCVLTSELVKASKEARGSYLKAESFRLLATLFNVKEDDEPDVKATLMKVSTDLFDSLVLALNDNDLKKAKWVRGILKVAEKVVDFTSIHGDANMWDGVSKLSEPLQKLSNISESNGVKSSCEKLEKKINEELEKRAASIKAESIATPSKKSPGSTTKSKTKKSGKKKKKKGKK